MDDNSEGELFSRHYLRPERNASDSEAFRIRLAAYIDTNCFKEHFDLANYLKREAGLKVPCIATSSSLHFNFEQYFTSINIESVLNTITLVWRFLWTKHAKYSDPSKVLERLSSSNRQGLEKPEQYCIEAQGWHSFVSRVFHEENLGYKLDEKCGVRYLVDQEFDRNKTSVIQALNSQRYTGVRQAFEQAHYYLDPQERNTKASVWSMFEALEILTKLMFPDAKNLSRHIVDKKLKHRAKELYAGDETASASISFLMDSFADWVDAIHYYRHGQGYEKLVAPSLSFTIYVLSSGASFLRFLLEMDIQLTQSQS